MQELLSQKIEAIRDKLAEIRSELDDAARNTFRDHIEPVIGLLTCGLIALHSANGEIINWEIHSIDIARGGSLKFRSRGIGLDVCPGCFICGAEYRNPEADKMGNGYLCNISGFVESKVDGEEIVEWFDGRARLDYRPSEPNWIQVKIGACDKHLPNLQKLHDLTAIHNVIRRADIADARELKVSE